MSELSQVLVALARIEGRIDAIEAARSLARHEQDEWRDEVRGELGEIKAVTRATNGRVTELEKWRERTIGFQAAFRWWPAVVALVVGSLITALVFHLP